MKQTLTEQERNHLDQRIADAEKRTGAEIVLAVVERSDTYAELPWRAFALGASVTGLLVTLLDLLRPEWASGSAVLLAVAAVLAAGAASALMCVSVPRFARLFLDAHRAEVEVRQYAESLFLSRELFATRQRTGVLLLVSLFEQQVVVLPDRGSGKRLSPEAMQGITKRQRAVFVPRAAPPSAVSRSHQGDQEEAGARAVPAVRAFQEEAGPRAEAALPGAGNDGCPHCQMVVYT